jgi:hypothetical protein
VAVALAGPLTGLDDLAVAIGILADEALVRRLLLAFVHAGLVAGAALVLLLAAALVLVLGAPLRLLRRRLRELPLILVHDVPFTPAFDIEGASHQHWQEENVSFEISPQLGLEVFLIQWVPSER